MKKPINNFTENVQLRNGTAVLLRAIRPDDKEMLAEAFHRLSKNSVHFRFLCSKKELLKEELTYLTEVDFQHHVGLVATIHRKDGERIIGVARYIDVHNQCVERSAEFAVAVIDEYQNLGLGTLMIKRLVQAAFINGIIRFEADVLVDNHVMKHVLDKIFPTRNYSSTPGIIKATMDIPYQLQ